MIFLMLSACFAAAMAEPCPEPYSYRLWNGFKLAALSDQQFLDALSQHFLNLTINFAKVNPSGLLAYLVATIQHAPLPNEIAMVVYANEETYNAKMATPQGAAYRAAHAKLFAVPPSKSIVPSVNLFASFANVSADGIAFDLCPTTRNWQVSGVPYVRAWPEADGGTQIATAAAAVANRLNEAACETGAIVQHVAMYKPGMGFVQFVLFNNATTWLASSALMAATAAMMPTLPALGALYVPWTIANTETWGAAVNIAL